MQQHMKIRKLQYSCAAVMTELFSTFISLKEDTSKSLFMKRDTVVASITLAFQEKISKVQLEVIYAHQDDTDLIYNLLTMPSTPLNMTLKDSNPLVCTVS